jgi:hypothetical protein
VERRAVKGFTFAMVVGMIALWVPGWGFQVPSSARAIVSRADRVYTTPVARSENAIPIGNGRMGARVWTTPSTLKFQINPVDIPPIDLELAESGAGVFTGAGTHQRLSVYEGLLDVKAAGVSARMLVWHERDVIAIEVDDRRAVPQPFQIKIAGSHMAVRDGRILITQDFQEGVHPIKSVVVIALLGRKTLTRLADKTEARIVSPGERGRVVILIASATTLDPGQDVAAMALRNLDAAAVKSFDDLAGDTAEWWHNFWQHNAIASNSADYHYSLYLTRTTGRRAQ